MAGNGLAFGLLGAVEARDGERVLRLRGSRQRGLLAYLLLRANRSVRTDELIGALWRDPPPSCRKIVQISVSQLRRSITDGLLVTEPHGYRLVVDLARIDAHRFESLVAAGRDALERGEATVAADTLEDALALWRGPALADLEMEPFVAAERRRLDELRWLATEAQIDAELALGREQAVIGRLEALVSAEPLREHPRAQLMLALYRAGRQADALATYRQGRKTLLEEVGVEPGPGLNRLHQAILQHERSLRPPAEDRPGLPPTKRLIGRERELDEVCAALRRPDVRLLNVTGPGGVGKTSVAMEAARRLAAELPGGATFVPLETLEDPALVAGRIGRALAHGSRDGSDALLVLDCFEHLVGAATELAELVRAEPSLTLLVTSRMSLRLTCEHEYALGPLDATPAVELFAERARAVSPQFALDEVSAGAVSEICRRLEGLPLSIELAAARIRLLAPDALLARLGRRLDVLVSGPRDAPARQQTLRATLEWSYRLLDNRQRRLLARLGAFAGGCELEAAEAVCGESEDVLVPLEGLVAHSLIGLEAGPPARIAMLETLREFAVELLDAGGDAEAVRAAHAEWFVELAEQAEAALTGPQQSVWLRRLDRDHANFVAALGWFEQAGDGPRMLRLAAALWHYWFTNGYHTEGRQWLARALAAPGESAPVVRAKALRLAASLARLQQDFAAAEQLAAEGLDLARQTADVPTVAGALSTAGNVAVRNGDLARARAIYEELLEIATASDFARGRANATVNLGSLALLEGEPERAIEMSRDAVGLASALGDAETRAVSLFNLGCAQLEAGEARQAAAAFADSTRLCLDGGFREQLVYCLVGVAAVAERRGDARGAGVLLGAADVMLEEIGAALAPYERGLHARTKTAVREALAQDADGAWSDGRRVRPEQTLEEALAQLA